MTPVNLSDVIPEGLPQGYFNGYAIGSSREDVVIVLTHNGRSTIALNTTPSHAKALALSLLQIVEGIEGLTGQTVRPFAGQMESNEEEKATA